MNGNELTERLEKSIEQHSIMKKVVEKVVNGHAKRKRTKPVRSEHRRSPTND